MRLDFINHTSLGKTRAHSQTDETYWRVLRMGASLVLTTLSFACWEANDVYAQQVDYTTPSSFASNQLKVSTLDSGRQNTDHSASRSASYNSIAPSSTQFNSSVSIPVTADSSVNPYGQTEAVYAQTRCPARTQTSVVQSANQQYQRTSVAPHAGAVGQTSGIVGAMPQSTPHISSVQPRFTQQVVNSLEQEISTVSGARATETLSDAMRIALAESRSQRALALKKGASHSNVQAARALANPKVTNTTSYVGMLNQPTNVSDLDLSSVASGISSAAPALAPIIAQFPIQFQVETPLCDKDFVTSVTAVTLPVYLGGRVRSLTRAAEALAQATAAGEDVGEQAVKFSVAEAYFLVLRTRQLRLVAGEAVQTADEHLLDAERMFNVGLLTRNVVLAAQVAASEARQVELKIANAQQLAEATYNRLLWRPLDAPVSIADVDMNEPARDLDSLTAEAVRTRGELQVLSAESRAIQEEERIARADVLPQVAIVGAYSYFENSHLKDNSNATAAVGMTWTPFDGGTSRARQSAARQNAMAVARVRDEAESAIRLQVRQAWLEEQEARQRVEVARVAVEQAEENLRVVTRGFQEGTVNHTETLDAATMRTSAKSNYTNARYDAMLAAQRLRYAVGSL